MDRYGRQVTKRIGDKLFKGKAIILYGPRQVGKTTLVNDLLSGLKYLRRELNCDNPDVREQLTNQNITSLSRLIGDSEIVFIDEAQRVENIGVTLKLLVDSLPQVQVIATGSSALELASTISEPLTGRKFSFKLLPISVKELLEENLGPLEFQRVLPGLLRYGMYPEVLTCSGEREREELVRELAGDALFKDIYAFQSIKNPSALRNLLKALALQVGSEVSNNELASLLAINARTVESYIDLLEKNYIVFRLSSYSRNLRNELKKSKKVYFYDLGIRNAIINNFNPLDSRLDVGALWENFCVVERMKTQEYLPLHANNFFWRTYDGAEIDWIEERAGVLHAYEMKWGKTKKKMRPPESFTNAYPNSTWEVIDPVRFESLLK